MEPMSEYGSPELPFANKERPPNKDMGIQKSQLFVTEDRPNPEKIKNSLQHDLPVIPEPKPPDGQQPLPSPQSWLPPEEKTDRGSNERQFAD